MKRNGIGFTADQSNTDAAGGSVIPASIMERVPGTFRPEFLNRLDELVLFHTLSKDDLRKIVDIQIGHLQMLLTERQLTLELSDQAKDYLAQQGWDEEYGARPLKRLVSSCATAWP